MEMVVAKNESVSNTTKAPKKAKDAVDHSTISCHDGNSPNNGGNAALKMNSLSAGGNATASSSTTVLKGVSQSLIERVSILQNIQF